MSVYSIKGKGWRFDFTMEGKRYTGAWYRTKKQARDAEHERRREVRNQQHASIQEIPTDMGFLELVNRRLDDVKDRNSERHFQDYRCLAKRWVKLWGKHSCSEVTEEQVEQFVRMRKRTGSLATANKEIRYLRATFNFGLKKRWIQNNPVLRIASYEVDRDVNPPPSQETIQAVIALAESDPWLMKRFPDTADYLIVLRDTLGRMSEINQMEWKDVDLFNRVLDLYTRKGRRGKTPRRIPMTLELYRTLCRRYGKRDEFKPWVFVNPRTGQPYRDRKRFMRRLCRKAGVEYFRFHPIRRSGASFMDYSNIALGSVQRLLGHKNRKTTELYLFPLREHERQAVEAFERAREQSLTQSLTQNEIISGKCRLRP
jgi:integrase